MIHIYDANNWVRRKLETALPGQSALRFLFNEIQQAPHVPVIVWDGAYASKRRRDIFPGYKVGRKPADPSMYANMNLLKDLLKLSKAIQVECKGWEADDVIATLAPSLKPAHIFTNDADLQALGYPTDREKPLPCPAHLVRIYKTLVGDPSDKIPGVKGFGEKAWNELIDPERFQLSLENDTAPPPGERLGSEGFKKSHIAWILENWGQLRAMWQIVGLYQVPEAEIEAGTTVGSNLPEAADQIMREHLN